MRGCSTSSPVAWKRIYEIPFKVRLSPAMRKKGIICNVYPCYSYAPVTASGATGWVSALRHGHSGSQGAQKFGIHSFRNSFRRGMTDAVCEHFSYSNRIRWNFGSVKVYWYKVKKKLSLYLTKYHATKIYDGVEV
jgi:hypothetical protein